APGRLARHQILLAAFGIDQRDAVEHVGALLLVGVLERLGDAVGERVGDLDRVALAAAGQRDARVEDDRRAAALELRDREDEAAAVRAALALGDWCRRRGVRRCRRRGGRRGRRVGRGRRARGVLVVAAAAAAQQRQRRDQREKSSHADERYPTGASLTPSAVRRRAPTASTASRATDVAATQRKNPWIVPGQRTCSTATPAARSASAYALPSSRRTSASAVITNAGATP